MCVLPMNMINQKVFTIVYFWLALLLVASIMWITLRIFLIASTTFRKIWWSFFFGVNTTNVSRKASEASNFLKRFFFFSEQNVQSFDSRRFPLVDPSDEKHEHCGQRAIRGTFEQKERIRSRSIICCSQLSSLHELLNRKKYTFYDFLFPCDFVPSHPCNRKL